MLADMAVREPEALNSLIATAKESVQVKS